jgi:methylated-DNA-protein-cysteine methyltransferase-like protein
MPKRTKGKPADEPADDIAEIYAVVAAIPRGKVATYGEVAELAGKPMGHRLVARAMRSCPARLPWQRVVGRHDARRAHISIGDPEHAALQRKLLEKEGVVFDDAGLIVMRKSGWIH